MKKALIIIFGIIVILVLAGILVWNMLPTIVSHKLSKQAGVSVTIGDIRVSPSMVRIDTIRVGNPSGYNKTPRALSVDELSVDIPLTRFFDQNIVIEEMKMDDVYIGLEFDSPRSKNGNWTTIMNNVSQSAGSEKEKAKKSGKTTTVLIKKLIITDLQIELAYKTGDQANRKLRPIDRIELTNISSEGGIPTSQIMNIVMQETLRNIFSKEGLQNMLDGILNPSDSGGGVMDTLKGLFSDAILLDNDWEDLVLELEEAQ
ncbi:MAG: AsmA family protein [Chlamydiia bacterium]|nr:AsmA family protein [Chlamydiia bacterium]